MSFLLVRKRSAAQTVACGRELNAKETPDGFLSHFLPFRKDETSCSSTHFQHRLLICTLYRQDESEDCTDECMKDMLNNIDFEVLLQAVAHST